MPQQQPTLRIDDPSAAPGGQARPSTWSTAAVAAASFVVVFWQSWRPVWSADETATIMVARRSWPEVFRTFWYDAALGPYYVVMHAWGSVSTSTVWMRLPSVLAMAATVTLVWSQTRRHRGPRAAALTCVVLLLLPATSSFGQDARPYSFALLLVVLLVVEWTRIGQRSLRITTGRLTALVALLALTHPYALTVVAVLLAACRLVEPSRRRECWRATWRASATALLLVSPFLALVALRANGQPNPPTLTVLHLADTAARIPVERLSVGLAVPLSVLVWGMALAGLIATVACGTRRARREASMLALWLFGPATLLCTFQAVTGSPGEVSRYWLFSLPALVIAAGSLAALRIRRIAAVCLALVVALAVTAWPSQLTVRGTNGHLGQGWAELSHVLALPLLRTTPLLTASWNYHALVADHPAITSRLPWVIDPGPSGRIVPQLAAAGSPAVVRLVHASDRVVVLATARRARAPVPSPSAFAAFGRELRPFPHLAVACVWFDQALAVFTTNGRVLSAGEERAVRDQVMAIAPGDVRCTDPDAAPAHG